MLKIKNLSVSVDDKKILNKLNYHFEKGKIYAIMGPNGSGKSTLAASIMGHPVYKLSSESQLEYKGKNIVEDEPHERAKKGIFLTFQSPLSLTGVNIYQLLRYALDGKRDPLEIRQEVIKHAKKLGIKKDLLSRSLNEDFSGGEKKKMEVLQAVMMSPSLLMLDEVDTGVDVDALKAISSFIKDMKSADRTFILITHYNRILKHLEPDEVIVMKDGAIAATGDKSLAEKIEKNGYKSV